MHRFFSATLSVVIRIAIFFVIALVIFFNWHDRMGRFMFFEVMNPPAADPHRVDHLRHAYYFIYGILGVVLGLVAAYRLTLPRLFATIFTAAILWMTIRYYGMPQFFDQASEEGYYGTRALIVVATPIAIILRLIPKFRPRDVDLR